MMPSPKLRGKPSRIRRAVRSISVFARAGIGWGLVAAVDKYIVENEPWALGEKQDEESRARLATVLYTRRKRCGS